MVIYLKLELVLIKTQTTKKENQEDIKIQKNEVSEGETKNDI